MSKQTKPTNPRPLNTTDIFLAFHVRDYLIEHKTSQFIAEITSVYVIRLIAEWNKCKPTHLPKAQIEATMYEEMMNDLDPQYDFNDEEKEELRSALTSAIRILARPIGFDVDPFYPQERSFFQRLRDLFRF